MLKCLYYNLYFFLVNVPIRPPADRTGFLLKDPNKKNLFSRKQQQHLCISQTLPLCDVLQGGGDVCVPRRRPRHGGGRGVPHQRRRTRAPRQNRVRRPGEPFQVVHCTT